jgi:hypothetical protein
MPWCAHGGGKDLSLGSTPPAVAPVGAAAAVTFFRENIPRNRLSTGIIATLANHGVAETLIISRKGRRTLVIA